MKKVFTDLSTEFFKGKLDSQVEFFKDLGDRIDKSRMQLQRSG